MYGKELDAHVRIARGSAKVLNFVFLRCVREVLEHLKFVWKQPRQLGGIQFSGQNATHRQIQIRILQTDRESVRVRGGAIHYY